MLLSFRPQLAQPVLVVLFLETGRFEERDFLVELNHLFPFVLVEASPQPGQPIPLCP